MDVEDYNEADSPEMKALKYAQQRFWKRGMYADIADIGCVEHYINEYFRTQHKSEKNVRVIYNDNQKKREYICNKLPGIPQAVIESVLEAEDDYYAEGMVKSND